MQNISFSTGRDNDEMISGRVTLVAMARNTFFTHREHPLVAMMLTLFLTQRTAPGKILSGYLITTCSFTASRVSDTRQLVMCMNDFEFKMIVSRLSMQYICYSRPEADMNLW